MRYLQLVDFDTSDPVYAVQQARDAWSAASRDKRTLHTAVAVEQVGAPDGPVDGLRPPDSSAAG